MSSIKCKCCSNKEYQECCEPYISGLRFPGSPEKLMRSRYTAYTNADIDYISKTMCGKAIAGFDKLDAETWAKTVKWEKLEVISSKLTSKTKGFVEFKATFIDNNQQVILHEISEFDYIKGKWFYVDGVILQT